MRQECKTVRQFYYAPTMMLPSLSIHVITTLILESYLEHLLRCRRNNPHIMRLPCKTSSCLCALFLQSGDSSNDQPRFSLALYSQHGKFYHHAQQCWDLTLFYSGFMRLIRYLHNKLPFHAQNLVYYKLRPSKHVIDGTSNYIQVSDYMHILQDGVQKS
jgi:hypothetical protein